MDTSDRKVIVITGATAGVGRATAEAFARRGWAVAVLARDRAALEDVQKQIQRAHEDLRDVRHSVEQAAALRTELEQLRGVATQLTQDYSKAREISREADDDAFAAGVGAAAAGLRCRPHMAHAPSRSSPLVRLRSLKNSTSPSQYSEPSPPQRQWNSLSDVSCAAPSPPARTPGR